MNPHGTPGRVAMVKPYLKRDLSLVGILKDDGMWVTAEGAFAVHVDDVRPLVTLDLNNIGSDGHSSLESLVDNLRNPPLHARFDWLANKIEAGS